MSSILKQQGPLFWLGLALILTCNSCKTSNDVVSNGFFQKRKYHPGFHLSKLSLTKHATASSERKAINPQDEKAPAPSTKEKRSSAQLYAEHRSSEERFPDVQLGISPAIKPSIKAIKPGISSKANKQRTEALQELKDLKNVNTNSIRASGGITAVSLLTILLTLYLASTTLAIPYLLIGAFYVAVVLLPVSALLTFFLLLERFQIKKGKTEFSGRFLKTVESITKVLRVASTVSVILFAAGTTWFLMSLIFGLVGLEIGLAAALLSIASNAFITVVAGGICLPLSHHSAAIKKNFNSIVMYLSFIYYAVVIFLIYYFFYWLHNL